MTATEILEELKPLGSESYKRVMSKHGVREPFYGVKIADLKKIQKRIRTDYRLALDLYDTGNYDAMYLAGLIADDARMTRKDLNRWLTKATHSALSSFVVAWVAAGSPHGWDLALEWIESRKPLVAEAGWATLRSLVSIKDDAELDLAKLKRLLERVRKTIHEAPNDVRSQMNWFVIAVGSFVKSLTDTAIRVGTEVGPVSIDMGDTSCRVPFAPDSIEKVRKRGAIGKKRKSAKC